MTTKAISYIRFSSTAQKQGDSVRRQNLLISRYLDNHPDVILTDLQFKDLGKSGFKGKHLEHGFGQLLQAIKQNQVNAGDILLVEAIDRLGRLEPSEMMELLMGILNAGVKIVTLEDNLSYDKSSMREGGIYILSGKIQQAHSHSEKLSYRIKSSWDNKRKQAEDGKFIQRHNVWYLTKDENGVGNVITPQNKALITKIFTMFLSGISLGAISRFVKKHDPIRFEKFTSSNLKQLLKNKTAIGYWGDLPNVSTPAISEELFYSVQNLFDARPKGLKASGATNHILSGLVVCGECGKNYHVKTNKNFSKTMGCGRVKTKQCTNRGEMPIGLINEFRMITQAGYVNKILQSSVNSELNKSVVALDGQISTLKTSIENLVVLVASGSKAGVAKTIELEKDLESLQIERAGIKTSETNINIENLRQAGLDMSTNPEVLNGMLKRVGYKIIINGKTMTSGTDQMEYIRYVKTSSKGGSYEVTVFGVTEYINKSLDTGLSQVEQVNTLMKASSGA